MKPFSNRRTKRITTFVAMLVWAFALVSGMANACLLEAPGQHVHIGAGHSANAHHVHASDEMAGDVLAADHADDTDASKDSCLKACDDGWNAQVKVQTGVNLTDPGLALLLAFAWNAAAPVASAPSRFDDLLVPVVGPPFRLRYSRLTL